MSNDTKLWVQGLSSFQALKFYNFNKVLFVGSLSQYKNGNYDMSNIALQDFHDYMQSRGIDQVKIIPLSLGLGNDAIIEKTDSNKFSYVFNPKLPSNRYNAYVSILEQQHKHLAENFDALIYQHRSFSELIVDELDKVLDISIEIKYLLLKVHKSVLASCFSLSSSSFYEDKKIDIGSNASIIINNKQITLWRTMKLSDLQAQLSVTESIAFLQYMTVDRYSYVKEISFLAFILSAKKKAYYIIHNDEKLDRLYHLLLAIQIFTKVKQIKNNSPYLTNGLMYQMLSLVNTD